MSNAVDPVTPLTLPVTPLTPQEKEMIEKLNKRSGENILPELKDNLQTAVQIELATIPIYLYTYYSIQRAEKSGENIRPVDLFANKAGGVIMSVAVEEMLHMSLSCNILFSLGRQPNLYGLSPGPYPTGLPHHNPVGHHRGPHGRTKVLIPLSKLTYEQLWHFLQIEYPEAAGAWPKDGKWDTIGQFYSYIRCLISCNHVHDEDFQKGAREYQIQPYNYSPNNIDTAHPKEAFNPWGIPPAQNVALTGKTENSPTAAKAAVFSNAPDSHVGKTPLLTISSKREALQAIDTICDQGEGFSHGPWDDLSHHEDSHYYKFLKLQAQMEQYLTRVEELADPPTPPKPITPTVTARELADVIVNFPDSPTTAGYDEKYRPVSDFCNGVYQYMLIMTETIFKVADTGSEAPNGQKMFFNTGMHRSMIWILDKLIQDMRKICFKNGQHLAPTFENYDLGSRKDCYATAYAKLISLSKAATIEGDPDFPSFTTLITALPNVSEYWPNETP